MNTRNATTLNRHIFVQSSKKDVKASLCRNAKSINYKTKNVRIKVLERNLTANVIVIEVVTEDALIRAESWNADFPKFFRNTPNARAARISDDET